MKTLAIENEDYEVAKRLKIRIDSERAQAALGYGVDTITGKMFEKSRDYKDIYIETI